MLFQTKIYHTTFGTISDDTFTNNANFGILLLSFPTTLSIVLGSLSWSGITLSAMCFTINP